MELYEHYFPMSEFEIAVRDIYLRHAPPLINGLADYTSQQLINLREDMLPEIQELSRRGNGFYEHSKRQVLNEMLYATRKHCVASVVSPYYPRYDPIPWHVSRYYEINCQLYGQSIFCLGNRTLVLNEGDMLIIPPGVWQTGGVFDDQGILRSFRLRSAEFQRSMPALLELDCGLSEFLKQTFSGTMTAAWRLYHLGANHPFGRWFDWLEEIYLSRDAMSRAREAGLVLIFFSDVERIAGGKAEQSLAQAADDEASQILSYFHLHLRTINRTDLAAHFNYSDRQITRIIEKHTGMNFAAYLRQSRLRYVAESLLLSDQPVAEIVASAGYQNNTYFYRQFRAMYDCSPQEYRDKYRPSFIL